MREEQAREILIEAEKRYLQRQNTETEAKPHVFSNEFEKKMKTLIAVDKKRNKFKLKPFGRKLIAFAAAMAMVGLGAAMAQQRRPEWKEPGLYLDDREDMAWVEFGDFQREAPMTYYIPSYKPEDYALDSWDVDKHFKRSLALRYSKGEGLEGFTYTQILGGKMSIRIGKDGNEVQRLTYRGHDAVYHQGEYGWSTFIWFDGTCIFYLNGYIGKEELIKVADSIAPILLEE